MEKDIAAIYSDMYRNGSKKIDDMLKESKGKIIGDSLVDITSKLLEICINHKLFLRDVITGLCRSCLSIEPNGLISPKQAKTLWFTHFKDRIRIRSLAMDGENYKLKVLNLQDLEILWENIYTFATYNSRKEMYENIPAWDGTPRIQTFMQDYFKCDTNPNFFLLFLTSLIGKMDDPEKNRCDFFFDVVGHQKGTGKTSFFKHLIGKYAVNLSMTSRKEDFFVNAYDSNALIVIDDECKWIDPSGKSHDKMSYNEYKNFVTQDYDKFSRKFQQPEEHARAFIICRTSNDPMTVFAPNERRQIIFKVNLPEHTCLHWQLDQNYMTQLLAEAKDYYIKNGMYKITDADWEDIERQNLDNFNIETDDFQALLKFVTQVFENPTENEKYISRITNDDGKWLCWRGYNQWRKDVKEIAIESRRFSKLMVMMAKVAPKMITYSPRMERLEGLSTLVHAGRLKSKYLANKPDLDNIPDMEL